MPAVHDDAICLRHREWSETSQTVTLLTRGHGLVHGLAKGSLREKAPFSGGFEHLQLGELGFIAKRDRDLALLTEWDLIDPFPPLRANYRSAVITMLVAELIAGALAPFDPHPAVFRAMSDLLGSVGRDDPLQGMARCLVHLLRETGQAPQLPEESAETHTIWAFDPAEGVFQPDSDRRRPASDPFDQAPIVGVWHLRSETLNRFVEISNATDADPAKQSFPDHDPLGDTRLALFLTACVIYRSARRPLSLDAFRRITGNGGAMAESP